MSVLPESFSRQAQALQVIIKPLADCTYENLVDLLNEMQILDVKYYALTRPAASKAEALRSQLSEGL